MQLCLLEGNDWLRREHTSGRRVRGRQACPIENRASQVAPSPNRVILTRTDATSGATWALPCIERYDATRSTPIERATYNNNSAH